MKNSDTTYIAQAYGQAKKYAAARRLVFFLNEENDIPVDFQMIIQRLDGYRECEDGIRLIPVKSIIGFTEDNQDYDASFNPLNDSVRPQWEVIAEQLACGEPFPPIKVRQIGPCYFVEAGFTYVSVCRYFAITSIQAHVTRIETQEAIRDTTEVRRLAT